MLNWFHNYKSKLGKRFSVYATILVILTTSMFLIIAIGIIRKMGDSILEENESFIISQSNIRLKEITRQQVENYGHTINSFQRFSQRICRTISHHPSRNSENTSDFLSSYKLEKSKKDYFVSTLPERNLFFDSKVTNINDISYQILQTELVNDLLEDAVYFSSLQSAWVMFESSLFRYYQLNNNYSFNSDSLFNNERFFEQYKLISSQFGENYKSVWTNSFSDSLSGNSIVTLLSPILNEKSELQGVLAFDVNIDRIKSNVLFSSPLQKRTISQGSQPYRMGTEFSFLLDNNARAIAFPREFLKDFSLKLNEDDFIGTVSFKTSTNEDVLKLARRMVSGENGLDTIIGETEKYYVSYRRLHDMQWSLCRVVPETDLLISINHSKNQIRKTTARAILYFIAISLIIVIITSFLLRVFVSGIILRPIKKLSAAINNIALGKYSQKIDITGQNEISRLAQSFNIMSEELQQSQMELKKHQQKLENLVQERTKELEETNEKLKIEIGEHKKTEGKLRKAKYAAEESDRLKTAFLSNMSHEIRTPLNSIMGFSSLVGKKDNTDEEREKYINIINTNGAALTKLLTDIIDIAKIEANQQDVNPESFEIKDFINEIYTSFPLTNPEAVNSDLKFFTELPDNPGNIVCDKIRLKQILGNLLENAFKFTKDGYVKFGMKYQINNDSEEEFLFYVEDTGIGIDPKFHSIIFDRFRQADGTFTREFGGTGLGLHICKKITELLGGKIWFNSMPEMGSTFYVTIPKSYLIDDIAKQEQFAANKQIDIQGIEIVVVENGSVFSKKIEELLGEYNSTVFPLSEIGFIEDIIKLNKNIRLIIISEEFLSENEVNGSDILPKLKSKLPVCILSNVEEGYSKLLRENMVIAKNNIEEGLKKAIYYFFKYEIK